MTVNTTRIAAKSEALYKVLKNLVSLEDSLLKEDENTDIVSSAIMKARYRIGRQMAISTARALLKSIEEE